MALEASTYATLALAATIAFGLISVSAFTLLNALSVKLHEKTQITKLMRIRTVYSMRSTDAQEMRDDPYSLYRDAISMYVTFCTLMIVLFVVSYHVHNEHFNMMSSFCFVVVCLGYTGWVVCRVSKASKKFISALRNDGD